jgi:predicted naringenin-chalcone synthase
MTTSSTDAVKAATDIWYKGKRVLRTLVQVAIPAFLSFALVLPAIIEALGLPADTELRLWLVAVAAGVTAVAGAISRVMAIPAVNAWLIKIGLGSVPASAIATRATPGADYVFVKKDPKADA